MKIWILPDSGLATVSNFETLLKPFREQNPGIEVEVSVINRRAMWQRMFSLIKNVHTEENPDIIEFPHYWTALFSKLGALKELTGLIDDVNKDWLDPLTSHIYMPHTDKIFSLPWWMDLTALHYREDHLKEITSNPADVLASWDGFLDMCQELKAKRTTPGYYPLESSNSLGTLTLRETLPNIWNRGGSVFSKDSLTATLNDHEAISGIEDYIYLLLKEYMPLMSERGALGTVIEGRASMHISRRQSISTASDYEGEFPLKTVPFPAQLFGAYSYMSCYNLGIAQNSANSQDALKLIKFLLLDENQVEYSKKIKAFPCTNSGFEKFIFSSNDRMHTYSSIAAGARVLPNYMVCATYVQSADAALHKIAADIGRHKYSPSNLVAELNKVCEEANYLISIYGG